MGRFTYMLMAAIGVYGVATALPPTVKLASLLASVGSAPVAAKVAEAPTGRWVTLSDAKLRCDTRAVLDEATTFFLATDAGLANPFVAQFVGAVSCEAAQAAVGGVFLADPLTLADLAQLGIDTKGATGLRLLTPTATPEYLRARIVPAAFLILIGLGMAAYGIRGLVRLRNAPRP